MLMLLFCVENERYALASEQIVEIVPLVNLKTLPHKPDYFAGVFNYRGQIVPVIDLCQLLHGKRSRDYLSTRIILVNYRGDCSLKSHNSYILGLMAERVVETLHKSDLDLVDINIQIGTAPYLGKMIVDEQGMIQCLRLEGLLSDSEEIHLLPESFNSDRTLLNT
ncbi:MULTISPECIES: chemotaxis protein CheW [Calothrix]|uniref:Chemotaxis protein CheW n=2 Tax=Calothrix TaxID=1186 RepID=A0ABR8AC77_9CYAN|nr:MULTISPECIES: chemotaxis protein CheW [Calothrix]MBD2197065.1 chemotaxis protein CheW [Calothrix parietina FACHB-288]MBD2225714.1 chemotaxis protein CheW [Calothrix anomala FACHB-343]